jgi:two-component system, chemotaxis family, protein-glutamate methylesterase/glutaminase
LSRRQKIRVLVVDDSSFVRLIVSRQLNAAPDIEVVGTASDGVEALVQVEALNPDVITLDVEMPRMNGLTTLRRIMSHRPTPVVMLSSLTTAGADITIQALEMGAVDFFLKQSTTNPVGADGTTEQLKDKVRGAFLVNSEALSPGRDVTASTGAGSKPDRSQTGQISHVVVIGSSTGGPRALAELLPAIPADIPAAFIVVQHMPPGFTTSLAKRLDAASEISVKEAEDGDRLQAGLALVAPGGFHVKVKRQGAVVMDEGPAVHGVRPSIDVTMQSVVERYCAEVVGMVLTGMGVDGAEGAGLIKAAGGTVLVEDESTCAVFGMPSAVQNAGFADTVAPIQDLASLLADVCAVPAGR